MHQAGIGIENRRQGRKRYGFVVYVNGAIRAFIDNTNFSSDTVCQDRGRADIRTYFQGTGLIHKAAVNNCEGAFFCLKVPLLKLTVLKGKVSRPQV